MLVAGHWGLEGVCSVHTAAVQRLPERKVIKTNAVIRPHHESHLQASLGPARPLLGTAVADPTA